MATVFDKRTSAANLTESSRKVHDPLQRLRVFIRSYVVTEALTTMLICIALFFWVGLVLDFGCFKLFGLDWVQALPRAFRGVLLGGGLLAICFMVEIRKVLKVQGEMPGRDAPALTVRSSAPDAGKYVGTIRTGLGMVLTGVFFLIFGVVLFLGAPVAALLGSVEMETGRVLILWSMGLLGLSILLSLFGKLVCLSSPYPAQGRAYIVAATACDAVGLVLLIVALATRMPQEIVNLMALFGLLGFVSFLLYLRETALFMNKPGVANLAIILLATAIGLPLLNAMAIASVSGFWVLSLVMVVLMAVISIVYVVLWFLTYLVLLGLLVIQGRALLLAAVATPVLVLYFAGWIGLSQLRDTGDLGALGVGLLVGGILTTLGTLVVVKRLLYEFSDISLALVLERRFPQILGDRLITAVELNDAAQAAKYGYSQAMIEQTIHEAALRVERLNLREVFDWKRLYVSGFTALALTVGGFLLGLGGMMGVAAAEGKDPSLGQALVDLDDTAAIWAERNVLLDNERWPTRSIVMLLGFPSSREMKYGRGVKGTDLVRVQLSARALEYVIHDRSVPDCWRVATLEDIRGLGITTVDEDSIPHQWRMLYPEAGWTVDDLRLNLQRIRDKDSKVKPPPSDVLDEMIATLERVDARVEESSMSRTLRRLKIPKSISIHWASEDGQTRNDVTMKGGNNEYTGTIEGLDKSINFYLAAEDFQSDNYRIILVPPPRVSKLESTEEHPAYRYHLAGRRGKQLAGQDTLNYDFDPIGGTVATSTAGLMADPSGAGALLTTAALYPGRPYDDDKFFLQGKKQLREPYRVSPLGNGDLEVTVPVGTNLVLKAEVSKKLVQSSFEIRTKEGSASRAGIKLEADKDRLDSFTLKFDNVRDAYDFELLFRDTDGALGAQTIKVTPILDTPPAIQQFKPEIVRQVGSKYMISPRAVIPFSFHITDDVGLASMDFVYSITETPSPNEAARRGARVAAAAALVIGTPEAPLSSQGYLRLLTPTLSEQRERIEGRMPVAHFLHELNQKRGIPWEKTLQQLRNRTFDAKSKDGIELIREYSAKTLADLDPYLQDHYTEIGKMVDPKRKAKDPAPDDDEEDIARKRPYMDVPLRGMDVALIERYDRGVYVPLKARDWEIQREFDMELRLEVRDTNIERPERGQPPLRFAIQFAIVSETQLLSEIAQEEQRLFDDILRTFAELKRAQGQMQSVRFDLPVEVNPDRPINFETFSVQVEGVRKVVDAGLQVVSKIYLDYDRILRELRTNRISNEEYVTKVRKEIVKPYREIRDGEHVLNRRGPDRIDRVGFPTVQSSASRLIKTLDHKDLSPKEKLSRARDLAKTTDEDLTNLIAALEIVKNLQQRVMDEKQILEKLKNIEQRERELLRILEEVQKKIENDFFEK